MVHHQIWSGAACGEKNSLVTNLPHRVTCRACRNYINQQLAKEKEFREAKPNIELKEAQLYQAQRECDVERRKLAKERVELQQQLAMLESRMVTLTREPEESEEVYPLNHWWDEPQLSALVEVQTIKLLEDMK